MMTVEDSTEDVAVSVVIPVLNEEENIEPLVSEIVAAMTGKTFEILFIDDGSSDATVEKILAQREIHSMIRILKFKRVRLSLLLPPLKSLKEKLASQWMVIYKMTRKKSRGSSPKWTRDMRWSVAGEQKEKTVLSKDGQAKYTTLCQER